MFHSLPCYLCTRYEKVISWQFSLIIFWFCYCFLILSQSLFSYFCFPNYRAPNSNITCSPSAATVLSVTTTTTTAGRKAGSSSSRNSSCNSNNNNRSKGWTAAHAVIEKQAEDEGKNVEKNR